ncbi:hypothetical protein AC630_31760 [Bradyrhizobium sp. AS23.2]|nr:hypothetical protein AC630_31760 [Bradyrhizobium sp. AS23.2]
MLNGAMRYAAERTGQDPKFTKHPATWLNGECWKDEPEPPARPRMSARDQSILDGLNLPLDGEEDER